MRIVLIEDNKEIAKHIIKILEREEHEVDYFRSIEKVIKKNSFYNYNFIILDLMLLGKSGDHLVTHIRKKTLNIPILVLSAITQCSVKVDLFKKGVDDYLTKPFDDAELLARIDSVSRRCEKNNVIQECGDISFKWEQNKVIREGKLIRLTNNECKLLRLLFQEQGEVVKTEDILAKIWRTKPGYHSNIVQSTIKRLRKKFDTGFSHKAIRSIHGVGYSLVLR